MKHLIKTTLEYLSITGSQGKAGSLKTPHSRVNLYLINVNAFSEHLDLAGGGLKPGHHLLRVVLAGGQVLRDLAPVLIIQPGRSLP